MDDDKKIIYTDSAKELLNKYTLKYADLIEKDIRDRKWIPGDNSIEITASDINYAVNQLEIVNRKKFPMQKIVIISYFTIGLALIIYSIFYNPIQLLLSEMTFIQQMMLSMGFLMVMLSILGYYSFNKRFSMKFIDFIEKRPPKYE